MPDFHGVKCGSSIEAAIDLCHLHKYSKPPHGSGGMAQPATALDIRPASAACDNCYVCLRGSRSPASEVIIAPTG
eukprot:scaffold212858_cov18-Prasinocladus_malaysianus.AAC.1